MKSVYSNIKNCVVNYPLVFLVLLFLASFLSFWRILFFDFFQDDFFVLWTTYYNFFDVYNYFKHPGTPIELYILSHIIGLQPMFWALCSIFLKIIVVYFTGKFAFSLTGSRKVGYIASLLFAVSYAGMDVMTTPLNNVPALASIPLLISFVYLMKSINEKKQYTKQFVLFLILAFSLDPGRIVPTFILVPFLLFLFSKGKNFAYMKHFVKKFLLTIGIIGIPLFLIWYMRFTADSQIGIFIKGMLIDPRHTIEKWKDIGNFFATITNLVTEPIFGLHLRAPFFEFANYTRLFGIIGVIILCVMILLFLLFVFKKSRTYGIFSLLLLWMFLFYIPNWFAEPRTALSAENHYLFISSIGYICFLAYGISFVRNKTLGILITVCLMSLNIWRANYSLAEQLPYRSAALNTKAWNTVLHTTSKKEKGDILLFTGDVSWAATSILPWGQFRYLLLTKDNSLSYAPFLTIDNNVIENNFCKSPIHLSHIFAWDVLAPGILRDTTHQERIRIQKEAQKNHCEVVE